MLVEIKRPWESPLILKLAFALYILAFLYIIGIGYYIIPYVLFLIAYILIVLNFSELKIFKWFDTKPVVHLVLIVFLFALLLRFLMLLQDQVITNDINMYVSRAEWVMAGKIPYEEFHVNKPPLYLYMLQAIGTCFGTGNLQFRSFFSIMDGVVCVLIFYVCKTKFSQDFSLKAAFAYALCPLPITAVGLSGHYEPVVLICVLLSLYFLLKNNFPMSAIFLGIGFALKFYPIVLLPFFMWRARNWYGRISYILIFSIPFIASIIPIVMLSPDAFFKYLYIQTLSWQPKKSFAYIYETLVGTDCLVCLKFSFIITLIFFFLLFFMFVHWVWKRFNINTWLKIVIMLYLLYYGLVFLASIEFYRSELGITNPLPLIIIIALIYFSIIFFVCDKYISRLNLKIERKEEIFVISSFAIIFLVLSSSQYNPWYLLWFLPFILCIKNFKVRMVLLCLMFWNFEGVGLQLFSGLAIG
jgi:hypothetical protein